MNISALPGERLARLGTSVVACSELQLQPSRGSPGSNLLWGPLSLHVNAIVWRNSVGVELGQSAQSRAQPESRI